MKTKPTFAAPILLFIVLTLRTFAAQLDFASSALSASPYLAYGFVLLIVYAIPVVIYTQYRGQALTGRMRLRPFHPEHLYLLFLALVALVAGTAALELLSAGFLGSDRLSAFAVSAFPADGDPAVYRIVAFCILPAILEEWLFRGILLTEYESVSPLWAAVIAALMEASFRLSAQSFLPSLYCALLYAAVVFITRSLIASVLLHVLNNGVSLLLERYLTRAVNVEGGRRSILILFLLVAAFVCLFAIFHEWQRVYADYGKDRLPAEYELLTARGEGTSIVQAVAAPPFVAYWIVLIAFAIWQWCT